MAGSGGADVRAQSSGRSAPAHGLRLRTRRRGGSAGPGPHPARGPGAAVRGHRSHAPVRQTRVITTGLMLFALFFGAVIVKKGGEGNANELIVDDSK